MLIRTKDKMKSIDVVREVWGAYRDRSFHRDYRKRRELYRRLAEERKLTHSQDATTDAVRSRLKARGYIPKPRQLGAVHTFAFVPRISWHSVLYHDLAELGPVSEYDYANDGYAWEEFAKFDANANRRRSEMNAKILPALRKAHKERPVDWFFAYASGLEIGPEILNAIHQEFGIPTVSMCLDDKNSWTGPVIDGNRSGQIDIAGAFDLSWTSARVACEWYLCEGGRPVYLPEGFDVRTCNAERANRPDLDVSFVGSSYGFRPLVVDFLNKHSVAMNTFGHGWNAGALSTSETVRVFTRSRINLGMGGIGYSEDLTNVKGRDFEIPGTGGGVYLTTFNSDLAQHFHVGQEILCYRSRDEMLELIRHYLANPEEAREIAVRGYSRCLKEHRWIHRYQHICRILGITR